MTTYAGVQAVGARFHLSVDPGAIESAGHRLNLLARHLTDVAAQLGTHFSSIDVESWQGVTRDAMSAELDTLAGQVAGFPDRFADAGAALLALAEQAREALATVRRANADWEASQSAYATAERHAQTAYRTTTRDLEVGADPATLTADRDRAAQARDATIRRAASNRDVTDGYTARAVDGAVAAVEDEARRAAAALAGAVLPGSGTPSDVPACRAPLAPAAVADLLGLDQTGRRFTEHWDDFASVEQAEQAGRETGDRLRDLAGTATDPQAVARLVRLATNPAFARGLYAELGPDGITTLPFYAAQTLSPRGFGSDPFGGDPDLREAADTQAQTVAAGLAGILVTLSHDPAVAPGLADDLVHAATTAYGSAYGLTVVLSKAEGMERDVARSLATGLYDAERSSGQSPYWRMLADTGAGVPYLAGTDGWYDAMVGVEELLARDPVLAQEFLLGPDGHGGDDGPQDRLAYLYGERTTRSDDGDALGRLLVAATTERDSGPQGSPGWTSATILSRTLTLWRDGDGSYHVPEDARDSLGLVLGVYFPELQNGLGQQVVGPTDMPVGRLVSGEGTRGAWGPVLGRTDAEQLLEAVVGDDSAFAALVTAQQATLRSQVAELLADPATAALDDERLAARIDSVARVNGRSSGAILDTANLTRIADAKDEDARRQLVIDVLDALSGAATLGLSDLQRGLPKILIEQVVDQVTSPDGLSLHSGSEGHARIAAASAWTTTQQAAVDEVVSVLFEQDYFAAGGRYADMSPEATSGIDSTSLRGPDGHLLSPAQMTPQVRQDYEAWLTASDVGNLATTVGQAFDSAQRDYQG